MVMDSKSPSPQLVGREFVRQYYTLLNKEPTHLHRFYSDDSSFVHGGLDSGNGKTAEPVHGQQEIHQRITQLNFRDCHAKIRQVDAHATLGSGVVVQVSGELSNRGLPMRRFMQTFVLAPQSPKKYYVLNDIFRYQDEVFSDDEQDEPPTTNLESPSAGPVTIAPVPDVVAENIKNTAEIVATNNNLPQQPKFPTQPNVGVGGDGITTVSINATTPHVEHPAECSAKKPKDNHVNGGHTELNERLEEIHDEGRSQPESEASSTLKETPAKEEPDDKRPQSSASAEEPESSGKQLLAPAPATPVSSAPQENSGGQLSYANLVKNGPGNSATVQVSSGPLPSAGFNKSPQTPSGGQGRSGETVVSKEGTPSPNFATGSGVTGGNTGKSFRGGGRGGGGSRTQPLPGARYSTSSARDDDGNREGRGSSSRGGYNASTLYPDCQQVFIGNLPHNCSETDLEALFGKFGKVMEVRISIKGVQQSKVMPSGQKKVPNFGFVVFETEEEAKECLSKVPIHLSDGHRINVETKKNKQMREESAGNSYHQGGGSSGGNSGQGVNVSNKNRNAMPSSSSSGINFGSQEQLGPRSGGGSWSGRGGSRGGGGGPRGGGRGGGPFSGGRGGSGSSGGGQGGQSNRGAYGGSRRT